jgi:hypothetical protein
MLICAQRVIDESGARWPGIDVSVFWLSLIFLATFETKCTNAAV